jgi:hypothetical protein
MVLAAPPAAALAAEGSAWSIDTGSVAGDDIILTWSERSAAGVEGEWADDAVLPDSEAAKSRYAEVDVSEEPVRIAPSAAPIASYGPFHLTRADTIEMIGMVDSDSPAQFAALMRAHPGARRLVMVECPGSVDEAANHALARSVRAAGLVTMVPTGGSVRSGAVDLFLAGVRRIAAPGAEFGVHSWRDEDGMEAGDFAIDDPVHGEYLGYYREMGLSEDAARRFYTLTNSVGFDDVRMLAGRDMARLGLAEVAG